MKYTKQQRLDIGRRIYEGELNRYEAAEEYGINYSTARDYMRLYRETNGLPPTRIKKAIKVPIHKEPSGLEDLESMTKEELIQEVVKARIQEARLKKGYEVKGDGAVILYDNTSIK